MSVVSHQQQLSLVAPTHVRGGSGDQQAKTDWANSCFAFSDEKTPKHTVTHLSSSATSPSHQSLIDSVVASKEGNFLLNKTPELPSSFKYHESAIRTDLFAARGLSPTLTSVMPASVNGTAGVSGTTGGADASVTADDGGDFAFPPPELDLTGRDSSLKIDGFTPAKLSVNPTLPTHEPAALDTTIHFSGFACGDTEVDQPHFGWSNEELNSRFNFEAHPYLCPCCNKPHKAIDVASLHTHIDACFAAKPRSTLLPKRVASASVDDTLSTIRRCASQLDLHTRITITETLNRLASTMGAARRGSPVPALSPRSMSCEVDVVRWLYSFNGTNTNSNNALTTKNNNINKLAAPFSKQRQQQQPSPSTVEVRKPAATNKGKRKKKSPSTSTRKVVSPAAKSRRLK